MVCIIFKCLKILIFQLYIVFVLCLDWYIRCDKCSYMYSYHLLLISNYEVWMTENDSVW
jgi:hypothetical protein